MVPDQTKKTLSMSEILNLGFIGIGKIAGAVIEGLCTSEIENVEIRLSPRNEKNSVRLSERFPNVHRMESNQDVLDRSDIVFLCLRPAQAEGILTGLSFQPNHTVVSLIPLIRHSRLATMVAPAGSICRAIPLPPVTSHHCPIPVFHATETVVNVLNFIGQTLPVSNEDHLHAIWTLTCLITPYYDLLNELSSWTQSHGVDSQLANRYIADLFESLAHAAQMEDPVVFRDLAVHAATPGGMNERTGQLIRELGSHAAYRQAADEILKRFPG
jgi:pyrroline-5-carboxylate reductase